MIDPTLQWMKRALLAYCAVFAALVACMPQKQAQLAPPPSPEDERGALIGGAGTGGGQEILIPPKPEAWQKTRDCDPDMDEHLINGACYAKMSRKPPCGPKLRRHGDGCFRFVTREPRLPSSIWP